MFKGDERDQSLIHKLFQLGLGHLNDVMNKWSRWIDPTQSRNQPRLENRLTKRTRNVIYTLAHCDKFMKMLTWFQRLHHCHFSSLRQVITALSSRKRVRDWVTKCLTKEGDGQGDSRSGRYIKSSHWTLMNACRPLRLRLSNLSRWRIWRLAFPSTIEIWWQWWPES